MNTDLIQKKMYVTQNISASKLNVKNSAKGVKKVELKYVCYSAKSEHFYMFYFR